MLDLLRSVKNVCCHAFQTIISDEEGVGVVEVILILIVLISLVVTFKDKISELLKTILKTAKTNAEGI